MSTRRPLATRRQLADHLQISVRTLDRHVANGTIPVIRVGKLQRFNIDDVTEALTAHTPNTRGARRTLAERLADHP